MTATSKVIVIGGGVIGLSTAYHLARKRFGRVVIFDKGPVGDGSSSRAAGIITDLLWSEPGVRARKKSLELYRELSQELAGYRFQDVGCLNLFDAPSWKERERLLPLYTSLSVPYEILDGPEMRRRWPDLDPGGECEPTPRVRPAGDGRPASGRARDPRTPPVRGPFERLPPVPAHHRA